MKKSIKKIWLVIISTILLLQGSSCSAINTNSLNNNSNLNSEKIQIENESIYMNNDVSLKFEYDDFLEIQKEFSEEKNLLLTSNIYSNDAYLFYITRENNVYKIWKKDLVSEEEFLLFETDEFEIFSFLVIDENKLLVGVIKEIQMFDVDLTFYYYDAITGELVEAIDQYQLPQQEITEIGFDGENYYFIQKSLNNVGMYEITVIAENKEPYTITQKASNDWITGYDGNIIFEGEENVLCYANEENKQGVNLITLKNFDIYSGSLYNYVYEKDILKINYMKLGEGVSKLLFINLQDKEIEKEFSYNFPDFTIPTKNGFFFEKRVDYPSELSVLYSSAEILLYSNELEQIKKFPIIEFEEPIGGFNCAVAGEKLYYYISNEEEMGIASVNAYI